MNKYQEALDNLLGYIAGLDGYVYGDIKYYCEKDIEKIKSVVDKETPIKVKKRLKAISPIHDTVMGTCLNCGEEDLKVNCNYCPNCGQKIKW